MKAHDPDNPGVGTLGTHGLDPHRLVEQRAAEDLALPDVASAQHGVCQDYTAIGSEFTGKPRRWHGTIRLRRSRASRGRFTSACSQDLLIHPRR
jgi:hypothetical protein